MGMFVFKLEDGMDGQDKDEGRRRAESAFALGDMSWCISLRLGLMGRGFMASWRNSVPGCRAVAS